MRRALAAVVALSCAGCFEVSSADVQVRDPGAVALETRDGKDSLPAGVSAAVVDRGTYWRMLSQEPYEVRALRDEHGAIALRCDACAAADFPLSGTDLAPLLDAGGRSSATSSWNVDIQPTRVAVDYDVCMVRGHRSCVLPVHTRLVAPMNEVVEVRRRIEPVRLWGYVMLAFGVVAVGAASYVMLAPGGGSVGERAPWGATMLAPGLAFGGMGFWETFSPAREQIWRP